LFKKGAESDAGGFQPYYGQFCFEQPFIEGDDMKQTDRKLKIGITCYPTLGGSGVVATELGKLLAEAGHQVHFITSSMPFRLGTFNPNIFFHEVQVNQYAVFQYPPYDLSLANKMAQVANRQKLDILHVHYAVPHALCAYLAKQMTHHPLKVITTLHGTDITVLGYDDSLKDLIRFGIEQSDRVTAVSDSLVRQTHDLIDPDREIDRVYNFVDERVYRNERALDLRRQYAPEGEKLIVHVSNFRPVKRTLDVARIFAQVSRDVPSKLLFIGEGPDFTKVCEWLHEHHLEGKVLFLGERDNVHDILSATDLMLLPSEKESFGLVGLEAMACGVPVIASDTGGLPELIRHGETGYVFPVGAVDDMAEATSALLQDEEKHKRFSLAAVKRARTQFNADDIVKQYVHIYRSVLEER
jgi:L-malate glycosyltransferase